LIGSANAWTDASLSLDGTTSPESDCALPAGTDWTVTSTGDGTIWIGQPKASQVVRMAVSDSGFEQIACFVGDGDDGFGTSIVVADVDGNGIQDLWVGAPENHLERGAAHLFRDAGDAQGNTRSDPDLTLIGTTPSDRLGQRLTECADFSGDGLPEVALWMPWLAEAPGTPVTPEDLGGAITMLESELVQLASGTTGPFDLGPTWAGATAGEGAGTAILCDQDYEGNSAPDVVIGAPWFGDADGRLYVISGIGGALDTSRSVPSSGSLADVATTIVEAPGTSEWFGSALLGLPGLGGRNSGTLAVGSPGFADGTGRVLLLDAGTLQESSASPTAQINGSEDANHFGRHLATADLDADGIADLIIGASDWQADNGAFDAGRVFVWSGSGAGVWPLKFTVLSANWTVDGDQPFQRVGRAMFAGDIDSDGTGELLLPTHRLTPDP
jgi:hypothetical protein